MGEIQSGVIRTFSQQLIPHTTDIIDRGKRRDQLYDYGAVMFDKFRTKSKIIGKVVSSLKDEEAGKKSTEKTGEATEQTSPAAESSRFTSTDRQKYESFL